MAPVYVPQEDGHPRRWMVLPVLLLGMFLLPLDFSIVNVALPSIRENLGATAGQTQLVIALYAVAYSVFLITGGRLGDLFGRKTMFLSGMVSFMIASAICGFAPSIHVLIAARLLQGVAAAAMAPQVLATIRVIFPAAERNRAIGYYGAVIGLALVLGQLVGGSLISIKPFGYGWESIFLVNLPVGMLDFVLAAWLLPKSERSSRVTFDFAGVAMLSVALVLFVYPLVAGREAGWPAWTLICLALSVPALALFVIWEQRLTRLCGHPLLDIRLFHDRAFSVGLALSFMVYSSSAIFFSFAIYLQSGLGWTVLEAGLGVLPLGFGFFFGSLAVPFLVARLGHGAPMLGYVGGALSHAVTIGILLHGGGPGVPMFTAMAVSGLSLGIVFPSLIRIVLQDIPPQHAGMAAGALNTMIQVGPAVAVPVIGGVFFNVLGQGGAADYRIAFATVLACVIATFCISLGLTFLLRSSRA
jgi:EmrB/QacA subfamily drug resistance transporter